MGEKMSVNGTEYQVLSLLGKGKGGYSYLVTDGVSRYVLKQIHHEPCSYYQFGDKLQAEINDHRRLREIGIKMPDLLEVDLKNERILKEFIDGPTIYELILRDADVAPYLAQLHEMCVLLYPAHTNIDYFPTNFAVRDGILFYIDFESNDYMDEWNFENWGIKYWSKTEEFLQYVMEHP